VQLEAKPLLDMKTAALRTAAAAKVASGKKAGAKTVTPVGKGKGKGGKKATGKGSN
jgi:hypothetical protein